MNRYDEFDAILTELNQPALGLEDTLNRAYKKKRKRTRKLIICPLCGMASCFAAFILLVNLSAPVANACSQIPILRELAASVTFSRSLTNAVENDYVQTINLQQTQNDITATIEYLIVDQKQVNIFYRLTSEKYTGEYENLAANPVITCDDENTSFYVYNHSFGEENGELLSATVDFTQGNVPDKLQCTLKVFFQYWHLSTASIESGPEYLAEIEFDLEFDPQFTAAGKVLSVNETVILDDQEITVTNIEVYPTHLRVEVAESKDNTAWLKNLDFYIETDQGMKFEPVSSGVTATGSADSLSMTSYRADSTYFYKAEQLKLVITGAVWLRKDMQTTYLNLITGEHGELPEGVAFEHIRKQGDDWSIKIRCVLEENGEMHRPFGDVYLDSSGKRFTTNGWYVAFTNPNKNSSPQYFYTFVTLKNYPYEEVWLTPSNTSIWTSEDPIEINIS